MYQAYGLKIKKASHFIALSGQFYAALQSKLNVKVIMNESLDVYQTPKLNCILNCFAKTLAYLIKQEWHFVATEDRILKPLGLISMSYSA